VQEYPNPVLRGILLRTLAPFLPIWLFGIVLALELRTSSLVPGALGRPQLVDFLLVYSLLVVALMAFLALVQYRSTPRSVAIDVDGIFGRLPGRGAPPEAGAGNASIPYTQVRTIAQGGLFGYRVEARSTPDPGAADAWWNLSEENAQRVAAAWLAWRDRERPADAG
jgi:hypothetical protein